MLGYINIEKLDLTLRDYIEYKSIYCSICNSLGKEFGNISRFSLAYDAVFIALCLDNIENQKHNLEFSCPLNGKKMKSNVSLQVIEYVSFINYYLMLIKLKDDILDKHSTIKKLLYLYFNNKKQFRKKATKYSGIIEKLDSHMQAIFEKETNNPNFDELLNLFGEFFCLIIKLYPGFNNGNDFETMHPVLNKIVFNLGKWVYLIDAYDDYMDDKNDGQFNLLELLNKDNNSMEQLHNKMIALTSILLMNMQLELNTVVFNKHDAIIKNIIVAGCPSCFRKICLKQYPGMYRNKEKQ